MCIRDNYRAVRQGLCEAGFVLLEPYYAFRLEVPSENLGRAMADLDRMQGEFSSPEQDGSMALLTGNAPVSTMRNYQRDVISYTKGRGRLTLSLSGYEPCHNAEAVSYTHLDVYKRQLFKPRIVSFSCSSSARTLM